MIDGTLLTACADPSRSASLLADVEAHGVAVAEGLVDGAACDAIAAECLHVFQDRSTVMTHEWYSLGRSTRCELADLCPESYPILRAFYESPLLTALIEDFFGPDAIPHRTIYVLDDQVGSELPVHELHYDKMRHLKCFLYLTDVTSSSGPFVCVPGSHHLTRAREAARRRRRTVPDDRQTRQLPPDLARREVEICGRRGTLIVFDSDIAHRASQPLFESRLSTRSLSFGSYRRERWFTEDGRLEHIDRRDGVRPVSAGVRPAS